MKFVFYIELDQAKLKQFHGFSFNFFTTEDNFLLSSENLPSSPELWPEKIPGSDEYAKTAHKNARENEKGLTQEDIRMIYRELKCN